MSGGFFNYTQYNMGEIARDIREVIENNDSTEVDEWGDPVSRNLDGDIIRKFKQGEFLIRVAEIYAQRIDWLLSGDDGEERFHRRLRDDLIELQMSYGKDAVDEMTAIAQELGLYNE